MKTLIITLILAVNIQGATFRFKDGTIVNGRIFQENHSLGNPSTQGVLLMVNNKFYIHHYPLKKKTIDHGDGTYTVTEELIPTPAPIVHGGTNPYPLPVCLPARINFIQFHPETLNNIYKYYAQKTKYHKLIIDKNPESIPDRVAFSRNKEIALGIYRAANTKNFKLNSQQLSSNWSRLVKKEYGRNSPLITWLGR
jgi:hypothetical protein